MGALTYIPFAGIENLKILSGVIIDLFSLVKPEEAIPTSELLLSATTKLTQEYKMARPKKYHNRVVKLGLCDWELCCHWEEGLHSRLRTIGPQLIKFNWVAARYGS